MIDVQLVTPGGVVTVLAADGSSWNARLSAGIWDAEDGLQAEVEGRMERVPFASECDRSEMLERLNRLPAGLMENDLRERMVRHVRRSGYYASED